jgi:hypothetical protein
MGMLKLPTAKFLQSVERKLGLENRNEGINKLLKICS